SPVVPWSCSPSRPLPPRDWLLGGALCRGHRSVVSVPRSQGCRCLPLVCRFARNQAELPENRIGSQNAEAFGVRSGRNGQMAGGDRFRVEHLFLSLAAALDSICDPFADTSS